jgi:hypothetical protein
MPSRLPKWRGQIAGRGLADIADAQRKDKARQRGLLALINGGHQILRRFFPHAPGRPAFRRQT